MKSLLLLLVLPAFASAHHGQDFFVNLDARTPAEGRFTAFATLTSSESDFTLEPGILAGIGGGLALGATADFTDNGSFHATGITPLLQWSAALGNSPLRIGISTAFHFSDSSRSPVGTTTGGGHHHNHRSARDVFNPDAPDPSGPAIDATPPAGSSTIHLHGTDYYQSRIMLEWSVSDRLRSVANLIAAGTSGSNLALGYSVGIRREVTPLLAVGLESIGDFNFHGHHQVIGSVIITPRHDLGLRLGLGHGLGSAGDSTSLHTGITWRF